VSLKATFLIFTRAHTRASYIEHVESLDPEDDEKPLRDITLRWLLQSASDWPVSADRRVYTFMHTNQFYDPEQREEKDELRLVNKLRYDTEIQEIHGSPLQYNILKERALKRVRFLANEMLAKKILAIDEGQLQRAKEFEDIWSNRQYYWEKKKMRMTVSSTATSKESDNCDNINPYDDNEDDCIPAVIRKRTKPRPEEPASQQNVFMLTHALMFIINLSRARLLRRHYAERPKSHQPQMILFPLTIAPPQINVRGPK
jgi:hypothetical protein